MKRLRCYFESDGPVMVVRLIGALGLTTASDAWIVLAKLLADQPDVLLADLSELTCEDPRALLGFTAIGRWASLWPGVPVILNITDPQLRAVVRRLGIDQMLAVCAGLDEAVVLAHAAPVPSRLREVMQPVRGTARRARDLATEACLRWYAPELVPPASIIATELVANAVRHAGTRFELSLARTPRYLHIAVRDEGPRLDTGRPYPTGCGLRIIERTALSWGAIPARHGKVVWATLPAR
jgi:hypothetical protein